MEESALKDTLARENAEFRKLVEAHQACERELEALQSRPVQGDTEALAERDLKKKKLALKDRMYQMMAEYGRGR